MNFTFGPNSAAQDLIDAVRDPSRWKTPNATEIEIDHWLWHSVAPSHYVGPNAWPAIENIDLSHLTPERSGVKLVIAYEGSNPDVPGDSRDYSGGTEAIRVWNDHIGPMIALQGGQVAAITLDEPRGHQPNEDLQKVCDSTVRVIDEIGLPAYLYEPWPYAKLSDILFEINNITDQAHLIHRFVMDINPLELSNQEAGWIVAVAEIRQTCEARGIEFAIAGTGHGSGQSSAEYVESAWDWCQLIAPYTERITVESWYGEGTALRHIPRTL